MKKKVCLLCSILCVMFLFWGCGSSDSSENASITDDWQFVLVHRLALKITGNALITDNWQILIMTVNGKTVTYEGIPVDSFAPEFSCSDGINFTFSLKGKSHSGTLTESGGVYTLNYKDTTKTMKAKISGNRMTITIADSNAMKLIFETK